MAAAGDDPDAIWLDVHGQTITVPLDLVEPGRPNRHLRLQQRKARLDAFAFWHRIELLLLLI
jgi:hypothetical protein